MGVQGLWHLLQPCARPTKLESLEGKRLAIDSSIWLYHFQMAMRDKEGRTLSNAHILGFLWRILKLIHFGIRPIFVFDGGAPVLKRKTLSGRKTRKAGARDDHRRVAERLLHARMREAAISHVTGTAAGQNEADANVNGKEASPAGHGLGQNTVYMEDLAGSTGASAAVQDTSKQADDGAVSVQTIREREREAEAARKKKRDQWQKDPYALPELEKDINTMTAENSTRARKAKGGGKRPDVRFATEGELRSLLSSIKPTDLDLDSEFFRSLPAELQYELVGDLRAASRGTSYKRLQAMLSQSPTPIDFSRAQIAGLKTRNQLTQKVLEVTDEIGDAHIKVPLRVAGARNREYVLVRNKGNEAGFALGVREAGNTEEKAIAVDEDTASATTNEDDGVRRDTEDEIDLEEVNIQNSPSKASSQVALPKELQDVNPNDPLARKKVARELLQRRARQLAKEKAREEGWVDENEVMEEQLERIRATRRSGTGRKAALKGAPDALFRSLADEAGRVNRIERIGQEDLVNGSDEEVSDSIQSEEAESPSAHTISDDEAVDLATALHESEQNGNGQPAVDAHDADDEFEMDEVDTDAFDASDYASYYAKGDSSNPTAASQHNGDPSLSSDLLAPQPAESNTRVDASAEPDKSRKKAYGLGVRLRDREGVPERLKPELPEKTQRQSQGEDEDEDKDKDKDDATPSSPSERQRLDKSILSTPQHKSFVKREEVLQDSEEKGEREVVPTEDMDMHTASSMTVKTEPSTPVRTEGSVRVENDVTDANGQDIHVVDFLDCKHEAITSPRSEHKAYFPRGSDKAGSGMVREDDRHDARATETRSPSLSQRDIGLKKYSPSDNANENMSANHTSPPTQIEQQPKNGETATFENEDGRSTGGDGDVDDAMVDIEVRNKLHNRTPSTDKTLGALEAEPSLFPDEEETEAETGRDRTQRPIDTAIEIAMHQEHEPEFDNITSMEDEQGRSPAIVPGTLAEIPQRRRREQSQKSEDWPSGSELPSGSPSPEREIALGPDGFPLPTAEELDAMEAEDEADLGQMDGDQDEFVSFLSRAKGRGLREVRQEVEDEVNRLRTEHATTRRTEGDVTIQMAKEIQLMLRLFGLPYITAPMEAEAQCAELVAIGLADGIITDDSDVFLFGGTFVYKNMFNNKKYVECYKLSDLDHDLGMDRTKLVQLAYLLGSDYTDGLEGVGPVLAMEILANFAGDDGLIQFREWWLKVQTGSDTPRDTHNATLKRLKRTLRNKIHFDSHWPDENVLNAYYEPTVDDSDEPFQWGLPDLDSLRSFFNEYLRWDREKTDHYLLPAIEEQNRRHRRTQATLDTSNFFGGQTAAAGRVRPGYNSSRLQQVIKNFRKSKAGPTQDQSRQGADNDPFTVSDSGEEEVQGAVPEQLVGKEMGKRSRPVVARRDAVDQSSQPQGRAEADADGQEQGNENNGVNQEEVEGGTKRKRATTTKRSGRGAKRGRGGRGATASASRSINAKRPAGSATPNPGNARVVQDEEWRPRAPRGRRNVQRSDSGTSLTQGRSMNLDNVEALVPPSRAGLLRDRSSSSLHSPAPCASRATSEDDGAADRRAIELSDDSSPLSE